MGQITRKRCIVDKGACATAWVLSYHLLEPAIGATNQPCLKPKQRSRHKDQNMFRKTDFQIRGGSIQETRLTCFSAQIDLWKDKRFRLKTVHADGGNSLARRTLQLRPSHPCWLHFRHIKYNEKPRENVLESKFAPRCRQEKYVKAIHRAKRRDWEQLWVVWIACYNPRLASDQMRRQR